MHRRKPSRSTLCLTALLAVLWTAPPAAASSITDALEGEWSGSGRLTLPNGKTERIRCRGTAHSSTANTVDQQFECASTGKSFRFTSSFHFSGKRVRGHWQGPGRSGTLLGNASDSSFQARLSSAQGGGDLSATIGRCRQTLEVTGWSEEMKALSVQLDKEC